MKKSFSAVQADRLNHINEQTVDLYGVNEMRESSVVIHKGRKEEKYEIYIEDYVMSFLKEETGTLELSEFYFYGIRENDNQRYVVYGAGREKNLTVFDKYSLLDEIGCRLTQAGPVFFIKEANSIYEVKGYDIFYQDNREMQNYLIDRKIEISENKQSSKGNEAVVDTYTKTADKRKTQQNRTSHSAISVQLGIILVALIAIAINSTNSYDKMNQLNQSALEVFFAIENQEAGGNAADSSVGGSEEEEDALKLAVLENEGQAQEEKDTKITDAETGEEEKTNDMATDDSASTEDAVVKEAADNTEGYEQDDSNEGSDGQEEIEALSRNVARYYEVEKGDTLYTISRKIYGDTTYVKKICELNQIADPDNIRYGQKIILP